MDNQKLKSVLTKELIHKKGHLYVCKKCGNLIKEGYGVLLDVVASHNKNRYYKFHNDCAEEKIKEMASKSKYKAKYQKKLNINNIPEEVKIKSPEEVNYFEKLYEYFVKFYSFGTDVPIPKDLIHHVNGLRLGKKLVSRNETLSNQKYSDELICKTIKNIENKIMDVCRTKDFETNKHRIFYIQSMILNRIDDIVEIKKRREKIEKVQAEKLKSQCDEQNQILSSKEKAERYLQNKSKSSKSDEAFNRLINK